MMTGTLTLLLSAGLLSAPAAGSHAMHASSSGMDGALVPIAASAPVAYAAVAHAALTAATQEQSPNWQVTEGELPHAHDGPLGPLHEAIEKQLRCDCGCGLDVHICQFQMQCGTSPVWSRRILEQLEQGGTEETILAGFVADFGQTVLMAPPMEGFNWLGYLLPGMMMLAAGGLIVAMLRKQSQTAEPVVATADRVSDADYSRLMDEIRRMEAEEDELAELD